MTVRAIAILALGVPLAADDRLFLEWLWPALERAQCRLCHNDNGVASTTRLHFPPEGAGREELLRFGLGLERFVDRASVARSLLLHKPTNRAAHAGGERIRQGSGEERALREWVDYLASRAPDSPVAKESHDVLKPVLRRLTHSQYNHTMRDLLGDETNPAAAFPKEDFVHGFTNQAEGQSISPLLAESYQRAAERLARNALRGGTRRLIPCDPSPACSERFIREFGSRAFRRPLTDADTARYSRLFARERDFAAGAQLVVEAMLVSPHFLFLLAPEPYGAASRLSYFLWDTMPDQELLTAAARGDLATPQGVERQVRRMLGDPRARASLDTFLAQWLRFDRLHSAIRDRRLFPEFTTELVRSMTEETRLLFNDVAWNGDFREFFSARYSFLTPELAAIYELPAPARSWDRVAFPADSARAGVLGQAAFLAVTSKPEETSPTERGLFIREHFLCQTVPPPPAGVNTTLPPVTDEKPMTNRQRLDIHLSNQACAGCHQLVDPIGFGFEKFDAIGRYRSHQVVTIHPTYDETKTRRKTRPSTYQLEIEASGVIRGLPDSEFSSPRQLGERLANEPACQRCVAKQLFRYAMGRHEEAADREALDAIAERFRRSQFRLTELIIAVATSKPFLGGPD